MSEDHTRGDFKFFVGLFLGGLIGALVIFFLGTKEGKKAGKAIEEKGKEALDDLQDTVTQIEQKGKDMLHQGEVIKDQILTQVETVKEDIQDTASEKLDSALAEIEAMQEQSLSTTAAIRKRFFKNLPKKH